MRSKYSRHQNIDLCSWLEDCGCHSKQNGMKRLILCLAITSLCASGFAQSPPKPIVMLNGQIVKDTANLNNFERIDYLSGKKGVELFGPKGGKGVIIIQADGKIPLYGEVISMKGKKIKHAEVISKEGKVLTTTNRCGTFFLPYIAIGETLTVRKKGYEIHQLMVQQSESRIELKRKKK
jgi:hypothetical protein